MRRPPADRLVQALRFPHPPPSPTCPTSRVPSGSIAPRTATPSYIRTCTWARESGGGLVRARAGLPGTSGGRAPGPLAGQRGSPSRTRAHPYPGRPRVYREPTRRVKTDTWPALEFKRDQSPSSRPMRAVPRPNTQMIRQGAGTSLNTRDPTPSPLRRLHVRPRVADRGDRPLTHSPFPTSVYGSEPKDRMTVGLHVLISTRHARADPLRAVSGARYGRHSKQGPPTAASPTRLSSRATGPK